MQSADPTAPTVSSAASEPGEERLEAGAKAGEYVIEEHVGAGAMGDVYRANHPVIGKQVAIKVIKRKLAGSAEALERFVREARAVNKINHPNVVDVFAMGRLTDGRLWLAMNYLEGESLGRFLRRQGPVSPEGLLDVMRPVCEALTAAHAQGVVHRDLKSDNIYLARTGTGEGQPLRVYVLDFGIAKVLADVAAQSHAASLTSEGAWIGTPAYMAPEAWTAEGASFKSDVYALGIVAFEMLTGHPPWVGTSLPAIMEQHFRAEVPTLSTPSGGIRVPERVEAVIRLALAKKPEERPESAAMFLALLEQALGETGVGTRPRGLGLGAAMARTGAGAAQRRRRLGLAVGLGAGVIGAGALAMIIGGGGQAKPATASVPIVIMTEPRGAEITVDGERQPSPAPMTIHATPGKTVKLRIEKAGYRPIVREIDTTQPQVDVPLEPITGFEGVWQTQNGKLRAFEHKGDAIAGYELDDVAGERRFLRHFVFRGQAGDTLAFGASVDEVFAERPNEATCHIPLWTEYRYDVERDTLEQRRQQVKVTLVDGKCRREGEIAWTPYERADRLARGGPTILESNAGTGGKVPPQMINAISPDANVITPDPKSVPEPTKKRPPKKQVNNSKNAPAIEQGNKPNIPAQDIKRNKEAVPTDKDVPTKDPPPEKPPAKGYEKPQQKEPPAQQQGSVPNDEPPIEQQKQRPVKQGVGGKVKK